MRVLVCLLVVVALAAARRHEKYMVEPPGLNKMTQKIDDKIKVDADFGDPIHETITLAAVNAAGGKLFGCSIGTDKLADIVKKVRDHPTEPDCQGLLRGAMWNDDPLAQFFDEGKAYSGTTAIAWVSAFKGCVLVDGLATKAANVFGANWKPVIDLTGPDAQPLCRSHYGDLMFLHAQDSTGTPPATSRSKVIEYGEFAYKVASGEIPCSTKLKDVKSPFISKNFILNAAQLKALELRTSQKKEASWMDKLKKFKDQVVNAVKNPDDLLRPGTNYNEITVGELYKAPPGVNCKSIAAGSLAHTIEDSYASGHAVRELVDPPATHARKDKLAKKWKGPVVMFTSYADQDGSLHKAKDRWDPKIADVEARFDVLEGARTAIASVASVFKPLAGGKKWSEGGKAAFEAVFELSKSAKPAAAGEGFAKKK